MFKDHEELIIEAQVKEGITQSQDEAIDDTTLWLYDFASKFEVWATFDRGEKNDLVKHDLDDAYDYDDGYYPEVW